MGPEQALRWKTRFAAMYALGAWTLLGYCVYYSREPLLSPLPPGAELIPDPLRAAPPRWLPAGLGPGCCSARCGLEGAAAAADSGSRIPALILGRAWLRDLGTMKAIIQRVTQASVTVGGEQISSIGRGICVLLGISLEDTHKELEHMVRKILNLRVFEDESGKHWSKSVTDKQYEVLCVSQFTLQCVLKGNKPDYHMAMPAEQAESFYNNFLEQLKKAYKPELIKDGKFGAYMQVNIQNDGPVTIELESPAATMDPKQLTKLEKQQQRKEKTRTKVPSESNRERNAPRNKDDPSASSGAEGDVSSEREP
ncbi:NADPH oxidase 3 [Platysternon megacephalum]|uniref:D-aminoacyl-tRNA deacylase n=1 Tax=Platysternon megacephalum TaxID=55544 RepID=A0A4D9EDC6_9SAUR|nr:NADPH oxidase 3 [Platysternon megacephalum]